MDNNPKNNKEFKAKVMDLLINEGYPDYAVALNGFKKVRMLPKNSGMIGATDYESILISQELTDKETSIVVRHEILHILLKHNKRRQELFNARRWNIAADLELSNFYSVADNKTVRESPILSSGVSVDLYPRYADKIAEEIYKMLDEEFVEQHSEAGDNNDNSESEQSDQGQSGSKSGDNKSKDDNNGESKTPENNKDKKIDQRSFSGELDISNLTPEQEKQLREAIEKAVQKAYEDGDEELRKALEDGQIQQATGVSLTTPDDLQIKKTPEVDDAIKLEYSLKKYFIQQQKVDKGRSYRRPHKKYIGSDIIVKARTNKYRPTKTLAIYIDQSGSMSEEKLKKAMAVTESIEGMKRVNTVKHYFDTSIHDEFRPGGGTSYEPIFIHARKNKYTCIAIITDDSTSPFEDYYDVEALWLVGVDDGDKDNYSITNIIRNKQVRARKFEVSIIKPDNEVEDSVNHI